MTTESPMTKSSLVFAVSLVPMSVRCLWCRSQRVVSPTSVVSLVCVSVSGIPGIHSVSDVPPGVSVLSTMSLSGVCSECSSLGSSIHTQTITIITSTITL